MVSIRRCGSLQSSRPINSGAFDSLFVLCRFVHNTTLQSALMIEDDVDWDIHLRTHQIPLVSAAVRKLIDRNTVHSALPDPGKLGAWGPLSDWEVLYLGHCGDYFRRESFDALAHERFRDASLPLPHKLHVETAKFLKDIGAGGHERFVHPSKAPLCTFAYAVTRASATRILRDFGHEQEHHGTPAFDVRMLEACRDQGWKCYTSNPELFHHVSEYSSEIASVNGAPIFPQGRKKRPKESANKGTPNIGCSTKKTVELLKHDPLALDLALSVATRPGLCLVENI